MVIIKKRTKLLKQREIQEDHRTFEEIIQEIKDNVDIMAKDYVPKLCNALKRQSPLMSSVAIRTKVVQEVGKPIGPWTERTIREYWPEWMKDPIKIKAGQASGRTRQSSVPSNVTQQDIEKEEEDTPISSQPIWEYEETHPKVEESPFQAKGRINRAISNLWQELTGKPNMPHMEDDVRKDHIIPTRERFKDIANGISKTERDFLFNWLTWLNICIKDRIDVLEKADKTAYDTRE